MSLPPLCRCRRCLILFLEVLLGARGADLGSLLDDLGSLLGVSFGSWEKGCRQQLKTSKTAPLCSARPVLPKRLPPSVLAVPRDLRLFDKITFHRSTPFCNVRPLLAKSAGQKDPRFADGVLFLNVFCLFL